MNSDPFDPTRQSIRIAALECLSSFVHLSFYKIFPYQKKSNVRFLKENLLDYG